MSSRRSATIHIESCNESRTSTNVMCLRLYDSFLLAAELSGWRNLCSLISDLRHLSGSLLYSSRVSSIASSPNVLSAGSVGRTRNHCGSHHCSPHLLRLVLVSDLETYAKAWQYRRFPRETILDQRSRDDRPRDRYTSKQHDSGQSCNYDARGISKHHTYWPSQNE